ncbi:hypothetical protein SPF06_13755 [Sinomonas sp. JGH33]|uniref:Lipoprotein n=1 Tax=Sinomonas terricola TaxID=3110330 RepID=A0ABU5T8D8_9MICC|nr:hypothetical protein [Sinomonas sp. JGH33]MEA5455795.1 hypothetical protein [Sinomonas sp. JGH33]
MGSRALAGAAAVWALLMAAVLTGCSDDGAWAQRSPQLRVTVAAGCPASLGPAQDVANDRQAGEALVPHDIPDRALLCIYESRASEGPGATGIRKQARLAEAEAIELENAVAAISLKSPKGPAACPAALPGAVAIIDFHFPNGTDFDLWYNTTGCQTLDNGTRAAFSGANPSFYEGFAPVYLRFTGVRP